MGVTVRLLRGRRNVVDLVGIGCEQVRGLDGPRVELRPCDSAWTSMLDPPMTVESKSISLAMNHARSSGQKRLATGAQRELISSAASIGHSVSGEANTILESTR